MFDDCTRNKQRELASLHKVGQQESVLGSEGDRIKYTRLDVHPRPSNGKSSGVQIPNATVWLKHVVLQAREPQFFCSPDQA
jgi:hypothetical protein